MEFLDHIISANQPLRELMEMVNYDRYDECSLRYMSRGDVLLNSGDDVKCAWFLINGDMWSFNTFINGHRYSTERIMPNSIIGDMEMVGDYPTYISTVTAKARCVLLEIPRDIFMHWFNNYPLFTKKIAVSNAAARCRSASEIGVNNMLSATDSICVLLCSFYNERAKNGESIIIPETRQELSEHVGISLRSVNRAIAGLENQGIISINKGKIVINEKSREKLQTLVKDNIKL